MYVYLQIIASKLSMQRLKDSWFVFTARTEEAPAEMMEKFKSKMECSYVIDKFLLSPRTKGA